MRARHLCAILVLALVASCSAWRPVPGVALAPVSTERIDHARVLVRDGTVLLLRDAMISPDSIVGLAGAPPTRVAVPRSDVTALEAEHAEAITSFLAGVLSVVGLLYLAVSLNNL